MTGFKTKLYRAWQGIDIDKRDVLKDEERVLFYTIERKNHVVGINLLDEILCIRRKDFIEFGERKIKEWLTEKLKDKALVNYLMKLVKKDLFGDEYEGKHKSI